jgi:beta-glucanase (GH16 family)
LRRPRSFGATIWRTEGQQLGTRNLETPDLSAAFHRYVVEWEPNRITFLFDGKAFYAADVAMPDPMYIMLDLWFGGYSADPNDAKLGPPPPTGPANSYEITYVRAWKFT